MVRKTGTPGPSTLDVELLLGNKPFRTVPAAQVGDPEQWVWCPPEGSYAAYSCPFSALGTIHSDNRPLRVSGAEPDGPA